MSLSVVSIVGLIFCILLNLKCDMKKSLLISVFVFFSSWINVYSQEFARGADVSWLTEMEASGRVWRDSNAVEKDLLDILPDYCINAIRLRVWVNPQNGWSGKTDVINLAKRAYDKGYRILIDFHYSDSWADPGQQTKPSAWEGYSIAQIEQAIESHTIDVLTGLKNEGVYPEWVQVGNETNDGMIWPEGRASANNNANMSVYAGYVDSGYEAVKSVFPEAKVVVHVANGYDNGLFRWNIGGLVNNGARFDVIGMSMYSDTPEEWSEYAQDALFNMQDMISRYGKEIMVAEIGLATNAPNEARAFVEQVISNLQSLNSDSGLGIFWWEPQAYNWRGYGKVAWNGNSGSDPYEATNAMKGFQFGCRATTVDCYGEEGGLAYYDDCERCVGGSTGLVACEAVNVTFKVDMTGQDVSNGVFITGAMTASNGENWQIIPMTNEGNGVYVTSFSLFPEQEGAYYYLSANDWAARETVPEECREWYDLDRGYVVPYQDVTLRNVWQSCEEGLVTSANAYNKEAIKVFPNPFYDKLRVSFPEPMTYQLRNQQGEIVNEGECLETCVIGGEVTKGVFYLLLENNDVRVVKKIIKY